MSLSLYTKSYAGPPLVTDDPGILNPGQWEINAAVDVVDTDAIETYDVPLLDVSYGLTVNTQMSVVISRQHVDLPDESTRSDFGYGEIGWKWRFFQNETVEIAFAPSYSLPLSNSATIRGVIEDTRLLNLPILAGFTKDKWTFNGQLAYATSTSDINAVNYGLAAGYQLTQRLQILAELYGVTTTRTSTTDMNYSVGFDYSFNDSLHLHLSGRSKLVSDLPEADHLNHGAYLALQWFK